jgi:hypothetical protein
MNLLSAIRDHFRRKPRPRGYYLLTRDMVPHLKMSHDITQEEDCSFEVRAIEIQFARPVLITLSVQRILVDLVNEMARATETPEFIHWAAGSGSKPLWREPEEPEWDDTIFHIETFSRERYDTEPFKPRAR